MQVPQTNPIKLIAVDLDGTLLNSKHELTPRTEHALRAAMDRGVKVVLATGKTRSSAEFVIKRLGLTTPGVYLQGLAVYDGNGTIVHQKTLDTAVAKRIAHFIETNGYTLMVYSGVEIFMRAHDKDADRLAKYHETNILPVGDQLEKKMDTLSIHKLHFFIDQPERVPIIRQGLDELLEGKATHVMPNNFIIEVLPPGASKGKGLSLLLKDEGIDPANVLALGDGENDVEMIKLAGIGVAMGNAMALPRAAADYITGTNDEDGVAQAVERFVLNAQ